MLNRYLLSGTLAAVCSAAVLTAQQPQPQPQQPTTPQPTTQQPRAGQPQPQPGTTASSTEARTPVTVVGCIYRESDVPGRAPNVAERAGILEDYIFMEIPGARPGAASAGGAASPGAGATASAGRDSETRGTTGAAGAAGAAATAGTIGRMYKVEFVDDEKLQTLVGRRVQATGQVDAEEGDSKNTAGATTSTTDAIIGRDQVNLSEFEISSLSEVEGTCPTLSGAAR